MISAFGVDHGGPVSKASSEGGDMGALWAKRKKAAKEPLKAKVDASGHLDHASWPRHLCPGCKVLKKSDRSSRLAGDAALLGAGAAGAHYAEKASKPYAARSAAKAAGGLLRGDPKVVRRAGSRALAAHKAAPVLRGAKLGLGAGAAALGVAAIDGALSDRKKKTPDLPPVLGTPRKGRYAT